MKSKLIVEITVEEDGVRLMLDGSFHGTSQSRIATIATLMRDLGLRPMEALAAAAQAFDKDYDDGFISGESTTIVMPNLNKDDE